MKRLAGTIYDRLPSMIEDWRRERGDRCWLWPHAKCPSGYGFVTHRRKLLKAHRVTYALVKGPIPAGLQLDHLCRNTSCVNPNHLEAVTTRENTMRSTGLSALNAKKTHCLRGHEFTPENTYVKRGDGARVCRQCAAERTRREGRWQGNPHGKDKTHCIHGHEFTPENTYLQKRARRRGGAGVERVCRRCVADAQKAYSDRKKSA